MAQERHYALILGVSSGFGRACAEALASEGYSIIGVHLDRAAAMARVDECRTAVLAHGVEALFFNVNAADAQKRQEVLTAVKEAFAKHEGTECTIKVLIHSLAFGTLLPLVAKKPGTFCSQRQLEMTLDVMANSLVYWTQDVLNADLFGRNSRIFALTSAGSQRVLPMYGAVSAAKAAIESYIRQFALELAPYAITANSIRAGVTDTPALRRIPGNDVIIEHALERNPYHRLTEPSDVANTIKLLVRPECNWINGTVIGVDGGEDIVDLIWAPETNEA